MECKTALFSGENNHFWNKSHSAESRAKMSNSLVALGGERLRGIKKKPAGAEHREMRSAQMRKRWADNRDTMIAALPRGEEHHWKKEPQERRHRLQFTALQRLEWKDNECAWCKSTENLVLDHILPIAAGGMNLRVNAQTLCQPCNLWKMWNVDRHLCHVIKTTSGGQI
ncbi:HNH endonuclease [Sinorhizobium sp. CB9]